MVMSYRTEIHLQFTTHMFVLKYSSRSVMHSSRLYGMDSRTVDLVPGRGGGGGGGILPYISHIGMCRPKGSTIFKHF